jgi:hypothetical protein
VTAPGARDPSPRSVVPSNAAGSRKGVAAYRQSPACARILPPLPRISDTSTVSITGSRTPRPGEASPKVDARGEGRPEQGEGVPGRGWAVPAWGGPVPEREGGVPETGGPVPKRGEPRPETGDRLPGWGDPVPVRDAAVPEEAAEERRFQGPPPGRAASKEDTTLPAPGRGPFACPDQGTDQGASRVTLAAPTRRGNVQIDGGPVGSERMAPCARPPSRS